MLYVEWLRVRRRLTIFMSIALALTALLVLPALFGHTSIGTHGDVSIGVMNSGTVTGPASQGLQQIAAHWRIPFSALLGIAGLLAYIFAAQVGSSLNAQNASLNLTFTKPQSRERIALLFFAIDLAGIALAYALSLLLVCLLPLAILGLLGHVYADPYIVPCAAVGLGAPFMYYGILQGATAWLRGGAGAIVGLSWPLFIITANSGQPPFGPLFAALLAFVRFLNPLEYLGAAMTRAVVPAVTTEPLGAIVASVWIIGFAGCALATLEWRRLEV
jgi:hypothetical protein